MLFIKKCVSEMNIFLCFKLSGKVLFYNNYLMIIYLKIDYVISILKLGN